MTAIGFISVVTAAITAAFIESARKRLEERRGRPIRSSIRRRGTLIAELKEIVSRLDRLDAKLDKLSGA